MVKALKNYFGTWWTIMARPIYFYTILKDEGWKEGALSFMLFSSWILSAAMVAVIFITQYIPIGATLVEGISGFKFIIVSPVLITLAFIFFALTLLILGGVLSVAFGCLFYGVGLAGHYVGLWMGVKGSLNNMLQKSFYSSAIVLLGIFPTIFALMTRYGALNFSLFRVGYNLTYYLMLLFAYGLWAIMVRKNCGLSKWKSFLVALAPVIVLLIFGLAFDKMIISKFETWITPLK